MKDASSPEDKLLKLIRNPRKPPDSPSAQTNLSKSNTTSGINKETSLRLEPNIHKYGNFFNLRKVFFWLFIASCIYLIISLIYPWVGLKNIRLPKPSGESTGEKQTTKLSVKPIEEYLKNVKGRQIFSGNAALQTAQSINVANIDLMKDISLVGIISGATPQAVIEDKKNQKTYYVTKGQFIGEIQIEEIQERKIIVNYAGQKYELNM